AEAPNASRRSRHRTKTIAQLGCPAMTLFGIAEDKIVRQLKPDLQKLVDSVASLTRTLALVAVVCTMIFAFRQAMEEKRAREFHEKRMMFSNLWVIQQMSLLGIDEVKIDLRMNPELQLQPQLQKLMESAARLMTALALAVIVCAVVFVSRQVMEEKRAREFHSKRMMLSNMWARTAERR
ncbi:hypothetical protein ID866_9846, partial [Astraeus odoratus]